MKKYLPWLLCLVLVGISYYFYNANQAAWAEIAAQRAKNKILAKAAADQAERTLYYKKLYDFEYAKRKDAEAGEDIAVAIAKKHIGDLKLAQGEIAKIKLCPDQVIALNFTLTQCREQYDKTVSDMSKIFDDFKLSCDKTISDMTLNVAECEGRVTHYSELYANMVAKHIKFVARSRRGRLLWVAVGVGVGIAFKSL
jgi:hypothetical protein